MKMDALPIPPPKLTDVVFVDLDGQFAEVMPSPSYELDIYHLDPKQPTVEFDIAFGQNPRNLCFFTQEHTIRLKIVTYEPSPDSVQPKLYNVFVNQRLRAIIRVVYIERFDVFIEE